MEVKEGYKQTEVGIIPEDWNAKQIRSITEIFGGGTPSTIVADYWDGEIAWVSAGDISNANGRYIQDTAKHITELGLASCPASTLPMSTTIIIARGATVGRIAQLGKIMAINQTCYGLLPENGLDKDFLYYSMLFSVNSIKALTYGTTFGAITTNSFNEWKIPIPPLPEQESIAEVLSDVDELIQKQDALIAKKRNIKQGAMQELLTGKRRLPGFFSGEWEERTFEEVFKFLKTGSNSRNELSNKGNIKYIHYGDIHSKWKLFLNCDKNNIPSINYEKVKTLSFVKDGDLIMADASEDQEGIGVTVEIKNLNGRKMVSGLHTILLRGDKELLADGFKAYITSIKTVKDQLRRLATGLSVFGVSKTTLKSVTVLVPPKNEQVAIARVLNDMYAEIEQLEQQRDKTKALKQGLMQELLTGKTRLI